LSFSSKVGRVFSPHGSLSRVVEAFEWRAQQAEMAATVADALVNRETWIIEAPTGVGKSLAYLVPGALWAGEEQAVLLVSTYTRNLQDQILRRDLPLLRRLTDRRVNVAVLKGRGNYLCRRRWERTREELSGTTDGEALVRALEGWVQRTESGDFDEGPQLQARLRGLLGRIASDGRLCTGSECAAESGCFFKLSRRRARDAQVVLVNHSLLVLELLRGGVGLPPWDALVIDEAHHLPRVAAEACARRVSAQSWTSDLLGLGGQGEPGATDQIRRVIRGWRSKTQRSRTLEDLRKMEVDLGGVLELSRGFFAAIRQVESYPGPGGRARYRLGAGAGGPFPPVTLPLIEAAQGLAERHRSLVRDLKDRLDEEPADAWPEIERRIDRVAEACEDLAFVVEAGDAGHVYCIEDHAREGVVLRARPLDLSSVLGQRLAAGGALVLTSATLADGKSARFFASQCGLQEIARELLLPAVFPIAKQVLCMAPTMIREPTEAQHVEDLAEGIQRLAVALPRKVLVLFTAHETLRSVEERIRVRLEDRGIWVYAQGKDATRSTLTEAFQKSDRAVLLGAASFWEGVDFPGADLEILVMARLPFPVPRDPFVEAYAERLREEGRDPFDAYMLPEAILRFRQGFGRLIRRRGDRGIFVILDPRILRRAYGTRFTGTLNGGVRAVDSWDALIAESERWFAGEAEAPGKEDG
jgi:Rad3-related DNA helicase